MGKIQIKRTHTGRTGRITIDPPEKMNAMTVEMRQDYGRAINEFSNDPKIQVVIVQGAGNKAFSAGGDISQFLKLAPKDLVTWGKEMETTEACPKPVIAAIDGFALGAGFELALACDIRIATEQSKFALPEVRLGMIPGSGSSQRLLRLIGPSRAKYWIMTGRRMGAAEAESLGIVSPVVPAGELDSAVEELVQEFLKFSPLSQSSQADASRWSRCSSRNCPRA
jgi:2-oxoglutaroyl-CoA hydrolase|tara:strand:- start:24 stop:695 length:672 start_codon:yes stop_codon:yes gene_type:complete